MKTMYQFLEQKDIVKLLDKIIESAKKQECFGDGLGHHLFCNYTTPYKGQTFCNCGIADLQYARSLAEKIKGELEL